MSRCTTPKSVPPISSTGNGSLGSHRVRCWWGIGLALWLVLAWALPALAVAVSDIPNPRVQNGWVSDTADQISAPIERQLNGLLTFLEGETGVEMAVVTVPAVPSNLTPRAFATDLFNTWGIGKADKNNGVLLLLTMAERRVEVVTGRGMGEQLPSDRISAIIRDTLHPALQQGDVDAGVWNGTAALVTALTGIDPNAPMAPARVRRVYGVLLAGGLALLGLGVSWIYGLARRPVLLPATGHHTHISRYAHTDLPELSFDRLVASTPYAARWPRLPLLVTAGGLVLSATALTFWGLAWGYVPYDTRSANLALLIVVIGSLLSLALIQPLNSAIRARSFQWREALLTGLILVLGGGLTLVGIVALGLGAFLLPWQWGTTVTEPLRIAVIMPLYVGLWNAGIAIYFIQDNARRLRIPPAYHCQICHSPIIPLDPYSPDLRHVHPQPGHFLYRGWRCPACQPTLSLEGIFLIAQEPRPKYASAYGSGASSSSTASYTSPDTSTPASASSYDDVSSWDTPSYGSSDSSSDFGGGASDGGGAGDTW